MEIVKQSDPIVIKRLAKNISGFKGDIWEKEISSILEEGLSAKFEQNDRLAKLLMATGKDTIVEANKHDSLCAIGQDLFHEDIWDRKTWQGKNLMGKALMSVRDKLHKMQEQGIYLFS